MNKKYKIIGVSNFNLETVDDVLIADNMNYHDGEIIVKHLQDMTSDYDTYYLILVEQDYELYKWEP